MSTREKFATSSYRFTSDKLYSLFLSVELENKTRLNEEGAEYPASSLSADIGRIHEKFRSYCRDVYTGIVENIEQGGELPPPTEYFDHSLAQIDRMAEIPWSTDISNSLKEAKGEAYRFSRVFKDVGVGAGGGAAVGTVVPIVGNVLGAFIGAAAGITNTQVQARKEFVKLASEIIEKQVRESCRSAEYYYSENAIRAYSRNLFFTRDDVQDFEQLGEQLRVWRIDLD